MLTHGSLFAGIGGFDLGFERAGIKTVWQVEIDPFCRRVLERNFPRAQRYADIRECHKLPWVDIIAGGFPCQPFSSAGRRAGNSDNRYLWPEMLRVITAVRPTFVVAENVSGILSLQDGAVLDEVYASLENAAYETLPPLIVPACAVGAGHRRDRVWIIAHSARSRKKRLSAEGSIRMADPDGCREDDGNSASSRFPDWSGGEMGQPQPLTEFERSNGTDVDDSKSQRCRLRQSAHDRPTEREIDAPANSGAMRKRTKEREIERDFRGVAYGVSNLVDRLRALGNSIVPQIAEWIGRRIVEASKL